MPPGIAGSSLAQDIPACPEAKFEGDNKVDQSDVVVFAGCMSGAGVPGDPDCAN
ncbi:MAG: hypothetical protein AMXMBFR13_29260 [Phycisphaerae bacterium]